MSIAIPVAMLHLVTGPQYRGPCPGFVNGYLLDLLLPFAFYFLLCLAPFPKSWIVRSLLIFTACASVEIAQYHGIHLLGRTHDPLDYVMYGSGVLAAAYLDIVVFPKIFRFWKPEPQ